MFKRAWLAGLAGVFAISAGVHAAKAETYNLTIVEGTCGAVSTNCTPNQGGSFPNAGFVGFTGTYTSTLAGGGLNFNLPSGGDDSIGGFLATGTGTFNLTPQNSALLTDKLSEGGFLKATLFIFSGNVVGANSGTITHDDGIRLVVGGNLITPAGDGDPTSAEDTLYTITAPMAGQLAQLFYVAANDLPEVLISPNILGTPLPGTVWLFGAGLGGIAMLMRRRRRGMVAA